MSTLKVTTNDNNEIIQMEVYEYSNVIQVVEVYFGGQPKLPKTIREAIALHQSKCGAPEYTDREIDNLEHIKYVYPIELVPDAPKGEPTNLAELHAYIHATHGLAKLLDPTVVLKLGYSVYSVNKAGDATTLDSLVPTLKEALHLRTVLLADMPFSSCIYVHRGAELMYKDTLETIEYIAYSLPDDNLEKED